MTAADLGAAIVPASAARIAPPGVQLIEIDVAHADWDVAFAWNPAALSGPLRNFLSLLDQTDPE